MKISVPAFIVSACMAMILTATGLAFVSGLRINHTPSLPIGLWQISPANAPVQRGQLVSFCPPETAIFREAISERIIGRGRCQSGSEPMLKPVIAVEGDQVEVTEAGITVNGVPVPHSARISLPRDSSLSNHIVPLGSYRLAPGQIWVMSALHPRSFDSRYFGPIELRQIEGIAEPIFTWP